MPLGFAVRATSFLVGLVAIYIALFTYDRETGKLQDRIEELWVKISDRALNIGSTATAFFNTISEVDAGILDRIYGKKVLGYTWWASRLLLERQSLFISLGLAP